MGHPPEEGRHSAASETPHEAETVGSPAVVPEQRSVIYRVPWWVTVAVFALAMLWFVLFAYRSLTYDGRYTADSVFYIDAARTLANGQGVSNSMARLDWMIAANRPLPDPMVTWAPLFPIVLAGATPLGYTAECAALAVPLIFLALCMVLACVLTVQCFDRRAALWALAALMQFSALHVAAAHAWSETMGIAFCLASATALLHARRERGGLAFVVISGILAGAAFGTRYALAPFLAVACLLAVLPGHPRRSLVRVGAVLAGFAAVAGPIFARNVYLTGHLGGPEPMSATIAWWLPWRDAATALGRAFIPSTPWLGVVYVMMLVAALPVLRMAATRDAAPSVLRDGRWLFLVWPAIYLFALVQSQYRYVIEPVNDRLALPATIFVLAGAVGLWTRAVHVSALGRTRLARIILPAAVLLIAGQAAWAQWQDTRLLFRVSPAAPCDFAHLAARSDLLVWVSEHVEQRDVIITIDSLDIPLYAGPVYTLFAYSALPPEAQPGYDEIVAYLQAHETEYAHCFIVLRAGYDADPPVTGYRLFDDLRAGRWRGYSGLSLEAELSDGWVYQLHWRP